MVICTAKSYPTANPNTDFSIQHPANCNVTISETSDMKGVIHTIEHAEIHDYGEYVCHVDIVMFNLHGVATKSLGTGKS